MKNKLIHLLALPTAYILWEYVSVWMRIGFWLFEQKPYVYRALVPWMANVLIWTGIPKNISYTLLVGLISVSTLFVLQKFYGEWVDGSMSWLWAYLSMWGLVVLLNSYPKSYDMMTVLLMTLCFLFILRENHLALILLFPLMCVNRETAFLIIPVCAVWFWRKMHLIAWMHMIFYQGISFVLIQTNIRAHYVSAATDAQYNRLSENIQTFIQYPLFTVLLIAGFSVVLWVVFREWKSKPAFLKVIFLAIFPIQFVLYLVFGSGYELRVFAEVCPVLFSLFAYSTKGVIYEIQEPKKREESLPKMQVYR